MANRNFSNAGRIWSMHYAPVLVTCDFVVDSTNGNGLGIRTLKGPLVKAVYMNTSATPAAGNPNPAAGTIVIQLQDNYSRVYTGGNSIASPLSGSSITPTGTNLTVGRAYTITALGAMTAADWIALGVPKGVVATSTFGVGVSFIAKAQGATSGGTSSVQITAAAGSGICSIETVGDPNLSVAPAPSANQGFGSQIIVQCRDYAGAIAAPAAGSVISLSFLLSNSSTPGAKAG